MFGIQGLTGTLSFCIVVAALGSAFQHGYNTGVVNNPEEVIQKWITDQWNSTHDGSTKNLEETKDFLKRAQFIYSIIVSIYCLGGMVGGFLTNIWSNIFGRKWGIVFNNVFIFISAILMGFSKKMESYVILVVGRFFVGINSGLNAGLVPMYLSEIAPISLRGGVGSMYQLFLTISILVAEILSQKQKPFFGNEKEWPILFGLIAIPAVVQVLLLPFCPDSPRYLQQRGKEDSAKSALQWFRRTADVQEEIDRIKSELEADKAAGSVGVFDLFTNPALRSPLIISCVIMLAQQFSGINAVIFYSTSTFQLANLKDEAQYATVIIGIMNVIMTLISTVIVDRAGRKTLLGIGFGAMFINTVILFICMVLAITYHSIIFARICVVVTALFVVFFAIGPGSIPWFLVSELFLQNARQKATSIAVAVNWIGNYIVSLSFPTLQVMLEAYVFVIFAAFQLLTLIYIIMKVPETKNRTVDEISSEFKRDTTET